MNGTCLRFYMHENTKHRDRLLYEWLLQHARSLGVQGGSVFRTVEGFGHTQQFFELAGDLTIEVEFLLTNELADRLLDSLQSEDVSLLYARLPAEFGLVGRRSQAEAAPG